MDKFVELVRNNIFEDIYVAGFVDIEDDGVLEFYPDHRFLYLQFGKQFIEVEFSIQLAKFRLAMVDSVLNRLEVDEDMKPGRCKISDVIFKASTSIVSNRIEWMSFYNLETKENEVICDALHMKLESGQDLFLAPSFFGINIGGLEIREDWLETLQYGNIVVPQPSTLDFRNK